MANAEQLRLRAEDALDGERTTEAEVLLDQLASVAEGDDAIFANLRLAELRLHRNPWRAALHLRKVIKACPDDDAPHALMGLSQALLGNHQAALSAFREALRLAPDVPWYAHNLGHLLDVAMGKPEEALPYLRQAVEGAEEHDEVQASLAHCLAQMGELKEASEYAARAIALAPASAAHRVLSAWIHQGAPEQLNTPSVFEPQDSIEERLTRELPAPTEKPTRIGAIQAWRTYQNEGEPRAVKENIACAALHYLGALHFGTKQSYAAMAKRYGCSASSVRRLAMTINQHLDLTDG